ERRPDAPGARGQAALSVRSNARGETPMKHRMALLVGILVCIAGLFQSLQAQSTPTGELVYAFHVTLSPNWFDPAGTPAQITPFGILYALHDALVRPLPGERMGPALAESWSESPDGTTYEFTLRS